MSFFSMDSPLMRFLNRMADLIVLNLLSILFAIPALISGYLTLAIYGETGQLPLVYLLITALLSFPVGASLTALHTVLIKMVKNEEGYIVKGFFKAFRDNFFQATAIGLLAAALTVLLIADLLIVKGWFRAFFAAAAFLLYGMLLYVYPLQARFYNPVGRTIRNSLLMEIAAFPPGREGSSEAGRGIIVRSRGSILVEGSTGAGSGKQVTIRRRGRFLHFVNSHRKSAFSSSV